MIEQDNFGIREVHPTALAQGVVYYRDAVETIKQITETIDDEELKLSYVQVPFRKRVFSEIKNLA